MAHNKAAFIVILVSEDNRSQVEISLVYEDNGNYVGYPTNSNITEPLQFPKYAWKLVEVVTPFNASNNT